MPLTRFLTGRKCTRPFAWISAAMATGLMFAQSAQAQLPQTRLFSLFPPGGQAGSAVDVTITNGADLEGVNSLTFTHPGITAAPKGTNAFTVSIPADTPPGIYDVFCHGDYGTSNPRSFVVGTRPEVQETEGNNSPETANVVELGQVINGRSNGATDLDHFRFQGKAGQRVIGHCQARGIDSRLQPVMELYDASGRRITHSGRKSQYESLIDTTLPAEGEYVLKLYDFVYAGSNDYVYRLSLHTGPHIDYALPAAGVPGTRSAVTFYGRNLPGGTDAGVAVDGRPLQKVTVDIDFPADARPADNRVNLFSYQSDVGGFTYTLTTPEGPSNPVFLAFAPHSVAVEQEPNDAPAQAQGLAVPASIAGQFQAQNDIDHFSFDAKAGDAFVIEVLAQRLGNPADAYLLVEQVTKQADGSETVKQLKAVDDEGTTLAPFHFDTNTYDPQYRFSAPADGQYRITLRDRHWESRGDPRLVYVLNVRKPQPDFELVAVPIPPLNPQNNNTAAPWGAGLRKGDSLGVQVLAVRRDGFNDTIELSAEGLPEGVACRGACLGPGQNSTTMIFTATANAPVWHGPVQIVGTVKREDAAKKQAAQVALQASLQAETQLAAAAKQRDEALAALQAAQKLADERQAAFATAEKAAAEARQAAQAAAQAFEQSKQVLARPADAGTIVWNGDQNVRAVARLSRALPLSVMGEAAPYQVSHDVPEFTAHQGSQILLPVKLDKRDGFDNQVALTFVGQPKDVDVENKPIEKGQTESLYRLFVKPSAPPGDYTIYMRSQAQVSYRRGLAVLERAKVQQVEAVAAVTAATEAEKTATAKQDAAVKQAAAAAQATTQAEAARQAAAKAAAEMAQAAAKAAEEHQQAESQSAAAAQAAEVAAQAAEAAKQALALQPEDAKLKEATAAAAKAAEEAAAAAKSLAARVAELAQKMRQAQAAAAQSAAELKKTEEALAAAKAQAATAQTAKVAAENELKQATAAKQSAEARKTALDAQVAAAEKAAAAKNVNVFAPSTPLVLHIRPAPVTLTVAVPNGGAVKVGEAIELKATVKRQNDFAGPVKLTLPLPPGTAGLSAEPVTIAADQTEGTLVLRVAADATEGQPANLVIRAEMQFQGNSAAVDQPLALKVTK